MDEKFMQEMKETLEGVKDLLRMMSLSGKEPAYSGSRKTDVISKTSLEIVQRIQAQKKECTDECKDRVKVANENICKDLKRLAEDLKKMNDKIFAVDEDAKASKTASGRVSTIEGDLEFLKHDKIDLENRINQLEDWKAELKEKKDKEDIKSRFKLTTVLTIISVFLAFSFGAASFIMQLIKILGGQQ